MSTNDLADRPWTLVGTAIGDVIRYFTREMLPAVPWRAASPWGIAIGAVFVIGGALELLPPATDYGLGSVVNQWTVIALCFGAGFWTAWRDGSERHLHIWHGSRVTLTAIVIGFLVAIVGNVSLVYTVSMFQPLDLRETLYWAVEVPVHVMLVIGGLVGTAGAAMAVATRELSRRGYRFSIR